MSPFAIIQTGGKQVRVEPNQVIGVERLRTTDDHQKEVILDKVLFLQKGESFEVGDPFIKGASVLCEFLGENKGPKTIIFKMKRRKNYRRKKGHRQLVTKLRVKEIRFQE